MVYFLLFISAPAVTNWQSGKPFRTESMGPAEDGKEKKPHKGDQERMFIEGEGELGKYTV